MGTNYKPVARIQRSPEEWLAAIEALPESVRPYIANIVWWDFFSNNTVANRWPHLDAFIWMHPIHFCEYPPQPELVAGMMAVGYPEEDAMRRWRIVLDPAWKPKLESRW